MANKLDDNLFDDSTLHPEASAAPAVDDSLFDDSTAHPDAAITEVPSESNPIQTMNNAVNAGAIGYGVGRGVEELNNKVVPAVLKSRLVGTLPKESVDFISNNRATYNSADSLENLLSQFRGLGEDVSTTKQGAAKHIVEGFKNVAADVNKSGFENANKAKEFLSTPDAQGLSKESFNKAVGQGLLNAQGAVGDYTPELKAQQSANVLETYRPQVQSLASQSLALENEMLKYPEGSDPHFELQNKKAAIDSQLNNLKSKVILESKTAPAKASGFPKEILESGPEFGDKYLSPAFQKQAQEAIEMGNSVKGDIIPPEMLGQKYGLVNQLRANANYNTMPGADTPDQGMAKVLAKQIRESLGQVNPKYDELQKASSRAINLGDNMGFDPNSFEEGKLVMKDAQAKRLEKIMANPEQFPEEFAKLQSELSGSQEFSSKQPLSLAQERLEQAARLEKELAKFKDTTAGENKILRTAADLNSPEAKTLIPALDEAATISSNPAAKSGTSLLNEINAAQIKQAAKEGAGLSNFNKNKILSGGIKGTAGALLGGQMAGAEGALGLGALGAASDIWGSKLQELAALGDTTRLGKLAKGFNSLLPGIFGAGGAMIGASAAANAGELTPGEAVVAGGAEALNPIPMTDIVRGTVEAKKAANEAQANLGDRDAAFEQEIALTGDLGVNPAQAALAANPIESARQAGFLKGFTSPVPAIAGLAKEGLESFGTSQSNDARSRMEQNMRGFKPEENEVLNNSKALKQATPEQLMELSRTFQEIKGADHFVAPLENAAQASSEEEKQARLFGLYQQPAFRQLLNKGKVN